MKRFVYSAYTKFAAVILAAACVVFGLYIVLDAAIAVERSETGLVYSFEEDFRESGRIASLLRTPEGEVFNACIETNEDFAGKLEYTDYEVRLAFEEHLEENLKHLDGSEKINYFVRINGKTYTNCGARSSDDIKASGIYSIAKIDAEGNQNHEFTSSTRYGYNSYKIDRVNDYLFEEIPVYASGEVEISAGLTEAYTAEFEAAWSGQEALVRETFFKAGGLAMLFLLLLVYLIAAAGRKATGEYVPMWLDSIWTELHLAFMAGVGIGAVWLCVMSTEEFMYGYMPDYMAWSIILSAAGLGVLLVINSLLSIVRKIKCGMFLKTSVICIIVKWVLKTALRVLKFVWRQAVSFAKGVRVMLSRKTGAVFFVLLIIYSGVLWFLGVLTYNMPLIMLFAALWFVCAGFFVAQRARELDEICFGVGEVRGGNLSYKIGELKSTDLDALAKNVNEIAAGLDESVAAKLRAERLKTELITNVSHDLKTPLTSIISYTELLSKAEGLTDEARDYVSIIAKKSDRLKTLTQDLFDISRVQSGNETVAMEKIDVALLIDQSLGEHDSEIKDSGLPFCVNTEKGLCITADGRKMSRVVSNLIGNILKYTMKNTRVFISASEKNGRVVIEFKNIASYPVDFDAEEIVGRFVRGDKSRSEEGHGLGLAIAKSYTELCGGRLDVVIDGDMFKVMITFPKC